LDQLAFNVDLLDVSDAQVARFDVGMIGFGVEMLSDLTAMLQKIIGISKKGFGAVIHLMFIQRRMMREPVRHEILEGLQEDSR
jgi:hypothetical protein